MMLFWPADMAFAAVVAYLETAGFFQKFKNIILLYFYIFLTHLGRSSRNVSLQKAIILKTEHEFLPKYPVDAISVGIRCSNKAVLTALKGWVGAQHRDSG